MDVVAELSRPDPIQALALNVNKVWPSGLVRLTPYRDRELHNRLGLSLPRGYKRLVYGGETIRKPVLRRAFMGLLPTEVLRYMDQPHFDGIFQEYCCNNTETLQQLLHPDAYLMRYGIVDHARLLEVLDSRESTKNIINDADYKCDD